MIRILDNGIDTKNLNCNYLWFYVEENGDRYYRVAVLRELHSLSVDRQLKEEGMLGKQWGALRGIYNSKTDFLYAALGIFSPDWYVGVSQWYGAAANGNTQRIAAEKAIRHAQAVSATLYANQQAEVIEPSLDLLKWYLNFMTHSYPLVILGHPDPRVKRHSQRSLEGILSGEANDDLSIEQNEILFRGMAALQKSFVFQINSQYISRSILTHQMKTVAGITSDYASRQRGVRSMSLNFSIPVIANAGNSVGMNAGRGINQGESSSHTDSESVGQSQGESYSESYGHSSSIGGSESFGESVSHSESDGYTFSEGETQSWSHSESEGGGNAVGSSWGESHGAAYSVGAGLNAGVGANAGVTANIGMSKNESATESHGISSGGSLVNSSNWSESNTVGGSKMQSSSISHSETDTVTQTHSQSRSWSNTESYAETNGISKGTSQQTGQADSIGKSSGFSSNQGGMLGFSGGMSAGISPGIAISRSFQTEDELAILTTQVMQSVLGQFNQASKEGAFMSDVLLFLEDEESQGIASSLIPQSFHGADTPTPVMTILPEKDDLAQLLQRSHAFLPWKEFEKSSLADPFLGSAWTRYGMMLTPQQIAAYTAPAILQEGTLQIISPLPPEAGFYPMQKGELVLGHQFSPTTGKLTPTPLRLDKRHLMHTMFCSNTGFGKSVAAMRLCVEAAVALNFRIVVFDFGFGWRSLLNAPGLEGRVDIRQLRPDKVRPLRWNPLKIGALINPEVQKEAFVDLFSNVAQLGQKRMIHDMRDIVETVYLNAGVLVDHDAVQNNSKWNHVLADETNKFGFQRDLHLSILTSEQRQMIAVERSKAVDITDLIGETLRRRDELPARDIVGRGIYDGIVARLNDLIRGQAGKQFGKDMPGSEGISIEELGRSDKDVVILEGGKFLSNFAKAFLLGWASWCLYTDMYEQRERQISTGEANTLMVFEEANIIFTGLDGANDEQRGPTVSEQYANMFRDSRKYGVYFLVISQQPSLIPQGIRSSCNNMVVGFLSDPDDKDVVLSAIARHEKGMHDEHWRRFLDDMRIGQVIGRFPYTFDRNLQLPVIFQPLLLNVPEPDDEEIARQLGVINLAY